MRQASRARGSSKWYEPLSEERLPALRQIPASAGRPRRRNLAKIITLSICVLLICASVYVAAEHTERTARYYFGPSEEQTVPDRQPQPYEDYREYFDNYFTGSSEILMPKAEPDGSRTLQLHPVRGQDLPLAEIYEKAGPAVAGISTYLEGEDLSWGTGVVFSPEGYVVTNTHILQGCDAADVTLADGRVYEARLVGADEISDIAVLYLEKAEDLPYAEFGQSGTLRVGETVCAIGNPLNPAYSRTMTDGIISAIDRNVTYEGHTMTLLQTNAALNEGNSGGPLLNAQGQVIGITNMKIMSTYMTTVEGIGFAIPSAVVKEVADQLMAQGYVPGEPTIGILAGSVSEEARSLYGLPEGVYVSEVQEGSDAREKGLREGDVITAVNGKAVGTVAEVNEMKDALQVGDTMTFTVYRDGEILEMEIALVDKGMIR